MRALRTAFSAISLFLLTAAFAPIAFACSEGCLFQKVTHLPNAQHLRVAAVGDVNNDGRADIVGIDDIYGDGDGVFVFVQGPDGIMQPPVGYFRGADDTTRLRATSVAIGDMNGDGRGDVVVATDRGIRVMLQNGLGQLGTIQDYATPANHKLRLGDFDRDGRLDVASAAGTTVSVFLQNAGGALDAPRNYALVDTGIADLELGDLDNDGRLDIVAMSTGFYLYRDLAVLLQDAAGGFTPAYYDLPVIDNPNGIGVGDVTGDGRADIVVTDSSATQIFVYAQNAGGVFDAPVMHVSGHIGARPEAVDVVDINQDGRPDAVVLAQYGSIYVHLQNPDGTLAPAKLHGIGYATTVIEPHSLAIGDVNNDGKPDVVVAKNVYLGGVDVHYAVRANLRMTFVADRSAALVDQPVRFTVTVVNEGPDVATDVRFAHTLPVGMFSSGPYANSQGTCDDVRRTCALGALAPGQTATVKFAAYAYEQPGRYTNAVALTAYTYDGSGADNQLALDTDVTRSADLRISSHGVSQPASGQVQYSIYVVNDGDIDAEGVVFTDTLPAGTAPLAAGWQEWFGSRSGACDIAGGQVTCALGTLAVTDIFSSGFPIVVSIRAQVMTSDNLLNVASVAAATGDPDTQNNVSSRLSTAQGAAIEQPPAIVFGGPATVRLGASAVLDARDTRDPEDGTLSPTSFEWTFADGGQAWGHEARHTFNTLGTSPVTLRVTDASGAVSVQTFDVAVVNTAPVAVVNAPYYLVRKNAEHAADAGRSYDIDGGPFTYTWDFGDGATATGPIGRHVYTLSGTYTTSVTVFDGAAGTSAAAKVFVFNTAPYANAGGRYQNQKNQPTNFDGSYSVDGNGDPLTYRWDFGDGTAGGGMRPVHTYAHGGVYTVTLIVNDGEVDSAPSVAQATVINNAPVANGGGPYAVLKNQPLILDGSGSSDADNDALTYRWSFGDGTTGSGVNPAHTYTKNGRFTVKLIVNDGDVDSAVYQTTVEVKNR